MVCSFTDPGMMPGPMTGVTAAAATAFTDGACAGSQSGAPCGFSCSAVSRSGAPPVATNASSSSITLARNASQPSCFTTNFMRFRCRCS